MREEGGCWRLDHASFPLLIGRRKDYIGVGAAFGVKPIMRSDMPTVGLWWLDRAQKTIRTVEAGQ